MKTITFFTALLASGNNDLEEKDVRGVLVNATHELGNLFSALTLEQVRLQEPGCS